MKKEWILPPISVAVTLAAALAITRWFAPQLLGLPPDLQMVRVADRIAPFFDGVFRPEDARSSTFILRDPYIKRAKPLYPDEGGMGPNDLLGFRNRAVPNVADVLVIGDSQTYGNNSRLEENWPSVMQAQLPGSPIVYSMAVGGWCAVEYLEIVPKAVLLQPRVIVLAFYTGNDPLDSFRLAYSDARWADLRPDARLTPSDAPPVPFPAPQSQWWSVHFPDGVMMTFTPKVRYSSNDDQPAARAGYRIMLESARPIAAIAARANVKLVVAIIPTKELAYAGKVAHAGLAAIDDYRALVTAEARNIDALAASIRQLPGVTYIDVVTPLQEAAMGPVGLYPEGPDGHPLALGYRIVGTTIAGVVRGLVPEPLDGPVKITTEQQPDRLFLIRDHRLWTATQRDVLAGNGWNVDAIPVVEPRDLATLPRAGLVDRVDRVRFGPRS